MFQELAENEEGAIRVLDEDRGEKEERKKKRSKYGEKSNKPRKFTSYRFQDPRLL